MAKKKDTLTTATGIPVTDNQHALTAGPHGPLLVQDWQLFEKHAHFHRERIPERVVHAKGSGAYGTLTITNDIMTYSTAKVFSNVGKTTECFLRVITQGRSPVRSCRTPGSVRGVLGNWYPYRDLPLFLQALY